MGWLARLANWLASGPARDVRGAAATRRHIIDLVEYLHAYRPALVDCGLRRRDGMPISTAAGRIALAGAFGEPFMRSETGKREGGRPPQDAT